MSKIINKENQKKLIITIVIIMLFNFVMPNYSFAIDGGIFFNPIAKFITWVADLIIQIFQLYFIGTGEMTFGNQVIIRYSPGIIFKGNLVAFDVNFINPNPNYTINQVRARIIGEKETKSYSLKELDMESGGTELLLEEGDGIIYKFMEDGILTDKMGRTLMTTYSITESDQANLPNIWGNGWDTSTSVYAIDILKAKNIEVVDEATLDEAENTAIQCGNDAVYQNIDLGPVIYNGIEYPEVNLSMTLGSWNMDQEYEDEDKNECYNTVKIKLTIYHYTFTNEDGKFTYEAYVNLEIIDSIPIEYYFEESGSLESIAQQLQGFIATWYKALKEVALVGLLLVLVYVSIRMILSSTASEKAKYKKMLMDWFVGVCIVFVMQYIISITIAITTSISKFLSANVTGEYGEDVLISSIRYKIGEKPPNFATIFAEVVMYVVLVVYTVLFTVQYLKRTVYLAFLIIISPLVAFTYPLDKIKDGKAQAFSSWLKEYIFTMLIQPVHLLLYVMLVSSAMDFVLEVPIYAIVVIGFLLPAEKFVKKMFGFDKASTIGNMASALGGATVMNAINKLGAKGGAKGKGEKQGETSGGGTSNGTSKVRMANNGSDPYEALRNKNNTGANEQGKGSSGATVRTNKATQSTEKANKAMQTATAQAKPKTNAQTAGGTKGIAQNGKGANAQKAQNAKANAQTKGKTQKANLKNSAGTKKGKWGARLKGGLKVAGKYSKNIARGAMRVAGAATLGTIGLAAGIATGDMSNAVAGLTGGMAAGSKLGASAVDGAVNLAKGANGVRRDIVDTYRGGKLGKDEAERIRFDKNFKKTEGYKNLIKKHEGSEETVQKFLNAGVTDVGQMGKAIEEGYNPEEAIAYMKMANSDECPDEVLNDTESFKTFLEARGIDSSNAEEIRKGIVKFK